MVPLRLVAALGLDEEEVHDLVDARALPYEPVGDLAQGRTDHPRPARLLADLPEGRVLECLPLLDQALGEAPNHVPGAGPAGRQEDLQPLLGPPEEDPAGRDLLLALHPATVAIRAPVAATRSPARIFRTEVASPPGKYTTS